MSKSQISILVVLLLQACYFGANPTFYDRELPGELRLFAMDAKSKLALWEPMEGTSGSFFAVVSPTIYEIGWCNDYVIVKSHPNNDKSVTIWHIVDITNNNATYEFVSEEAFNRGRKEFVRIPDTLSFFLAFEELR